MGFGNLNGDGFGIGWFPHEEQAEADPTPCVFTSITPAWNNENLTRLSQKITSPLIFAHVRAAYPGALPPALPPLLPPAYASRRDCCAADIYCAHQRRNVHTWLASWWPNPLAGVTACPAIAIARLLATLRKLHRILFVSIRPPRPPGMPVSEQNCHPFQWGRYLWMHNGVVGGFHCIRRSLLARLSDAAYNTIQSFQSDSAVSFAVFLHHLPDLTAQLPPDVLLRAMQARFAFFCTC